MAFEHLEYNAYVPAGLLLVFKVLSALYNLRLIIKRLYYKQVILQTSTNINITNECAQLATDSLPNPTSWLRAVIFELALLHQVVKNVTLLLGFATP